MSVNDEDPNGDPQRSPGGARPHRSQHQPPSPQAAGWDPRFNQGRTPGQLRGPYLQQPYPQQPLARPTSGLAVTALISSVLWGCGLLSALGILLGFLAMKETGKGLRGGHGMAVAAVIIGFLGLIPAGLWILLTIGAAAGSA